ncbi:hypothetical protein [Paraburkholderia sartisoli]|uniref:Uncharacterized protein n=1 Tax=Paraburkholderia sartisoli TaxID=83784 RepID=A0A1H4HSP3_9BURK|nr:hypothetical protein [Paraburkholderia sartisoli]SEB24755.1 hypothetical protein SAMN05192564_1159 [Paraburkholderia sartisoli]
MIHIHKSGHAHVLTRARDFYQAAKWLVTNAPAFGGGAFEIWRYEKRGKNVTQELEAEFDTDVTFDADLDLL